MKADGNPSMTDPSTRNSAPSPDKCAIRAAIEALYEDSDVIELRAIFKGKKRTDAGYFDFEHRDALVEEASRLNRDGATIYVNLNRLNPQLLSRYANRIGPFAERTACDADVTLRRWLLLDFDPVRPADTSATNEQLDAAKQRAKQCYDELKANGWPDPLVALSGNGYHLLYPLELPNDVPSKDLVRAVLGGLAARFDDDVVKLDQTVYNAARITKLYGTVSNKGDHTASAPWRLAKLTRQTSHQPVKLEQLQAVARRPSVVANSVTRREFELDDFLARLAIPYVADVHQGAERYKLERCPFNENHGKGEAAIFRHPNGALGFKCQHDSCRDRHWRDVRELVDGPSDGRSSRAPAGGHVDGIAVDLADLPEPVPLPTLPPVPELPMDILPDGFRRWIEDSSERARFRPDFMAVAAMVAIGSLIGRKVGIRLKANDDWTEHGNIWGAIVGNPSGLKSPALRSALAPLKRLQVESDDEHRAAIERWRGDAEVSKLRRDAERKDIAKKLARSPSADVAITTELEPAPVARVYWTSDATVERLGELASENPNGLLIERDELSGLLKTLEEEKQAAARGFYLSGWSGNEGYRFDRIIRGKTNLPKYALSIIGTIQPGPLASVVQGAQSGERADGFLQRFQLIVWPDPYPFEYVDRWPEREAREEAFRLFNQANEFDADLVGKHDAQGDDPPFLKLSEGAQRLFVAWYTSFMRARGDAERHGTEAGPLAAHFGKYPGLLGKLALIIHVCDNPDQSLVSKRTMEKALGWIAYLEPHARRVYHSAKSQETHVAALLISKLRDSELPQRFKPWEIVRKGWHGLTDRDSVKRACRLLNEYCWLIEVDHEGSGLGRRPDSTYTVNPLAL